MKILITGGASGLGEAITKKLAVDSANFVNFTYCKSEKNAGAIENEFNNSKAYYCDFSSESSVKDLSAKIDQMDLDVLINNALAGIMKKHFHRSAPVEYAKSFLENVLPVITITSVALNLFRKKKAGRIINVLSSYILDAPPIGLSEYAANKSYLLSLSNSWAAENSKLGIISNCISPDVMAGGLNKDTDERLLQEIAEKSPTGKLLSFDETAGVVKYLLTAPHSINGKNIDIRAGVDINNPLGL